ncbi:MAG: hypothetical protein LBQ51_00395 [Desulfovibrio sp.]|nr:hypothetical protein [Desulfovibrio sp.]
MAEKLRVAFPDLDIVYAREGMPCHFVVVICGCPVSCASHENLHGLKGKMIVSSGDEGEKALTAIRTISRKGSDDDDHLRKSLCPG